ncbi:MAG: hypothetical protein U9N02_09090 [Campylobacterota bacterium]|nr:hypothetical protein [Campylobacterota bacterium]
MEEIKSYFDSFIASVPAIRGKNQKYEKESIERFKAITIISGVIIYLNFLTNTIPRATKANIAPILSAINVMLTGSEKLGT